MFTTNLECRKGQPAVLNEASAFSHTANKSSCLDISGLTVSYQGKNALHDVFCQFPKGQITGVIGPNGAGKSTLFKAVLGLIKCDSGTITPADGLTRKDIAYVEQRSLLDLSFPITVQEMVALGTYPKLGLFHRAGKLQKQQAATALETVQMLPFAKRQIGELSGGQLQRVFIARALAQQAELFLLDEPFVGIDAVSEAVIMEVLKNLKAQGKSVVIVHHDLHKVREYFTSIILLNRTLIAQGSVENAFHTTNINKAYGESMGDVLVKGA